MIIILVIECDIIFVGMNLIDKIFSSKTSVRKQKASQISVYLDADCQRSIETTNQTVENYCRENEF